MRSRFRPLVSLVLSAALLLGCVGCGGSAKAPTTITVWNYYSGDLLSSFNALVNQFNATVGKETPPSAKRRTSWSRASIRAA